MRALAGPTLSPSSRAAALAGTAATHQAAVGLLCVIAACSSKPAEPEPPRLASVILTIATGEQPLLAHDTTRVAISGLDQFGKPITIGPPTWRSELPSVAEIDGAGLITGLTTGTTRITGTVNGVSGTVPIVVGGTLHRESVRSSMTWARIDGPHVVEGTIAVGGPAGVVLTIEPGAVVIMRPDAGLHFGATGPGRLLTLGGVGVEFRPPNSGLRWGEMTFEGPAESVLRNVTLTGCGGSFPVATTCIRLRESPGAAQPRLSVDSLTINDSQGTGIILESRVPFAPNSRALMISGTLGPGVVMSAAAAGSFPADSRVFGSGINEVRLTSDTIATSTTLRRYLFTWHVTGRIWVEGPEQPTLTIEPGARLLFDRDAGITIGKNSPGRLVAGVPGGDYVVLGAFDLGSPWAGLQFMGQSAGSSVARTVIQDCSGGIENIPGCVAIWGDGSSAGAAPVLSDVIVQRAEQVAIGIGKGGGFGVGSKGLRVLDTKGTVMLMFPDAIPTIPRGEYTGNQFDAVAVFGDVITTSARWPAIGIPYSLNTLTVEGEAAPVVTLSPGVTVQFRQGSGVRIGRLAPGGLRALGTPDSVVTFKGEVLRGEAGFWNGIEIGPLASSSTLFDYAIIDDAGGDNGTIQAAIKLAIDLGGMIRNTTIRRSARCGIARLPGPWATDFTAPFLRNLFIDNAGPDQCGP